MFLLSVRKKKRPPNKNNNRLTMIIYLHFM